jgi:dTDP-4-dehydrorhamnose 3,5-epimerase
MKILENPFKNAFVLQAEPYVDHRGKFGRIYCQNELKQIGHYKQIVQINHFQYPPKVEIKMVKCLRGSVFDVIVDLRRDSDTLLQWYGDILSDDNLKMMYVPEGFAHGFQTLEENTELLYLHTEFYSPRHEGGVVYNDPMLSIEWPLETTEVSEKDQKYPLLSESFEGILLQ